MDIQNIFDLPINEFEKEFKKMLDTLSDDEFISVLKVNGMEIKYEDEYYTTVKQNNYFFQDEICKKNFGVKLGQPINRNSYSGESRELREAA